MLRRLRYQLYQRVLRFPLHHFDRTATGQVIAMMTGELEPVGGFIGDAFALPISQGGTLLTIFVFMFVQDPVLGAAAVAFYPLAGLFDPQDAAHHSPARPRTGAQSSRAFGPYRRDDRRAGRNSRQ